LSANPKPKPIDVPRRNVKPTKDPTPRLNRVGNLNPNLGLKNKIGNMPRTITTIGQGASSKPISTQIGGRPQGGMSGLGGFRGGPRR
jgi:hypothetical protein